MSGGSSHDRRKAGRAAPYGSSGSAKFMSSTTANKNSLKGLWLGVLWGTGVTIVLALMTSAGSMTPQRVGLLTILGGVVFLVVVHLHGWTKSWSQAIWKFVVIVVVMGALGWQALPQPKAAIIEMQISPSSFPISIPARSIISILQLHPNIILSDKDDYLLKDDNTQNKDLFWPTQTEIDSKSPQDHETVYRIEFINHSGEALTDGKVLFQLGYNAGLSGGGCMPPKEQAEYQKDFVLLPALDPGKSFDFYAINQSDSCVWLIPPEMATVKMASNDTERQVALKLDKDPLYPSGAPIFPPTKIKWESLPTRPGGYQIRRIVN